MNRGNPSGSWYAGVNGLVGLAVRAPGWLHRRWRHADREAVRVSETAIGSNRGRRRGLAVCAAPRAAASRGVVAPSGPRASQLRTGRRGARRRAEQSPTTVVVEDLRELVTGASHDAGGGGSSHAKISIKLASTAGGPWVLCCNSGCPP